MAFVWNIPHAESPPQASRRIASSLAAWKGRFERHKVTLAAWATGVLFLALLATQIQGTLAEITAPAGLVHSIEIKAH